MSRSQGKSDHVAVKRLPPVGLRTWLILAGVIALGVLLRGVRLSEAPGGYLVFNEGFYIELATRMAQQPAFGWFLHPLDVNNPPLYPALISWLYRFGAPYVAGARAISVLAGAWSVFVTFLLGRLLYDERTGVTAAALLAVMPGVALVDHNIQVDPLFVALLLTSVYMYVFAARTGVDIWALIGGGMLGLAFLTKQPAAIAIPALALWETWCVHGLSWLKKGRAWRLALGFTVVGVPWYLAQVALNNISPMFSNAGRIAGESATIGSTWFWSTAFFGELAWMLFPLVGALCVGALVYAGWRRQAGDKLLLVLAATYSAWYLAFHIHSYYLLPLAPVLVLAVARLSTGLLAQRIPWGWARTALVGGLVVLMAFASVLMLGGQKWGKWSPVGYDREPDAGYSSVQLYYGSEIAGIYGPALQMASPGLRTTSCATVDGFLSTPEKPGVENLLLGIVLVDADGRAAPSLERLADEWVRPVVFGYAIGLPTSRTTRMSSLTAAQYFANMPWTFERVGPWWRFGMQSTMVDSGLFLYNKACLTAER